MVLVINKIVNTITINTAKSTCPYAVQNSFLLCKYSAYDSYAIRNSSSELLGLCFAHS